MSKDWDPLVHGPAPDPAGEPQFGVDAGIPLAPDPEESTPWSDFRDLFRRPRLFFVGLGTRSSVSRSLVLKALLGFFFFSWIGGFVSGQRWLGGDLTVWAKGLSELAERSETRSLLLMMGWPVDPAALQAKLMAWGVITTQIKIVAGPIFETGYLALSALTALLILPLVGVPKSRVSFASILTALLYAGWFNVLKILPWFGDFLAGIVVFLMGISAVKWMYDTTGFRAFLALKFLNVVTMLAVTAGLVGLGFFAASAR